MLEKVLKFLKKFLPLEVDPTLFEDERALRVSWKPNKRGGSNFKTTHFDKSDPKKWKVAPSTSIYFFIGIFISVGSLIFSNGLNTKNLPAIVFGAIFSGVGLFIIKQIKNTHLEIDFLQKKITYEKNKSVQFDDIIAIQIIEEYCRGDKKSYYSYELNFVLSNYSRITFMDHGDEEYIAAEAKNLAKRLKCPLWDATEYNLRILYKKRDRAAS